MGLVENKKFRIVLADSGPQLFRLRQYLQEREDLELCGVARDGETLLDLLSQNLDPDILILDSELRRISGVQVLYKIPALRLKRMPKILITTCTTNELVHRQYIAAGANCVVLKPYRMEDLFMQAVGLCLVPQELKEYRLDYLIRLYLEGMHLTVGEVGYWYLAESAKIIVQQSIICGLFKEVYESCANHFGVSPKTVESGVRRAIERIHAMESPAYREMQRFLKIDEDKLISNREFLGRMAQQITQEWGN